MSHGDSGADPEGPRRRVHWDRLGVGLFPLGLIAAKLDMPELVAIAMCIAGGLIGLFAFDLPRRASRWLRSMHGDYLQHAMEDHRVREAFRLCSESADMLNALFPSDSRGPPSRALLPWHRGRQIVVSYERSHRAAVVHAIEAAIGANVRGAGPLLALGKDPRDIADLYRLQAGLLQMVLELGQRLSRAPTEAVTGGSYGT